MPTVSWEDCPRTDTLELQEKLQIPRFRGFAIDDDGFTLGALALKLSNFCSIRVYDRRRFNAWDVTVGELPQLDRIG